MCDLVPTCRKPTGFWVQSVPSAHNAHACTAHLARTCRHIEAAAHEFMRADGEPDMRYAIDGVARRSHVPAANYANVTVKPYRTP